MTVLDETCSGASSSTSVPNENDEEAQTETSPLVIGKKLKNTGGLVSEVTASAEPGNFEKQDIFYQPGVWILNLQRHFGYKLLTMLAISQHLMKGFATSFYAPAVQYLYASYKVEGPRMQVFGGVTMLPWAMKPVIGLVSDCFPIRGYNKGPYILATSCVGIVALAMLGAAPQALLGVDRVVMCLFLVSLQFATCDLLTEAKYAEKMQAKPEHGPDLLTFVWFGLQAGGLVATVFVGPVMTHFGPKAAFLIALIPASMIVMPTMKNYLEETPKSAEDVQAARAQMFQQKEACILCVLMFLGTVILTVLGICLESVKLNALVALIIAVVMLLSFSLLLRPVIAKVNAFFLLQTALSFSIGGATFYFFTDGPTEFPEGPHFSMEFFTSVLGVIGSVCSLVGILSYQRFMKNWSYRRLLLGTNVVASLLSFLDVMILSRTNVRFGIPDTAFVLGSSVLQSVVSQWMWMPGVVILSQLCPKGMEATMYALLAGCHNLGSTIAQNCGAYVLELLGCAPQGKPNESSQFEHLWIGSALSTVLPMLTLVLIPWLIPDARQTDKLLDENDRDCTSGSLWRRLMGN
jgi:folate/biopterin transporter